MDVKGNVGEVEDRLVGIREAAQMLGLSPYTLRARIKDGSAADFRPIKLFGQWKLPLGNLRAVLAGARGRA